MVYTDNAKRTLMEKSGTKYEEVELFKIGGKYFIASEVAKVLSERIDPIAEKDINIPK